MVRNSVFLLLFFLPVTLSAQTAEKSAHSTEQTRGSCYTNPILPGDYPDPYIFRDGDDFYMTHSLFEYYPGGLIWHSKDWCIGSRFAVRFIKIPICWVFVIPTTNNAKQTER